MRTYCDRNSTSLRVTLAIHLSYRADTVGSITQLVLVYAPHCSRHGERRVVPRRFEPGLLGVEGVHLLFWKESMKAREKNQH